MLTRGTVCPERNLRKDGVQQSRHLLRRRRSRQRPGFDRPELDAIRRINACVVCAFVVVT